MNELISYRIATTQAGLARGYLFVRKIDAPSTCVYRDFTEALPQSDGGQVQHGYKNVTITWGAASARTAYYIKNIVETALAGTKQLYLTIPRNDAGKGAKVFIDVVGRPIPIDVAETGTVGSFGFAFNQLVLTVNNLTILNDPAVF